VLFVTIIAPETSERTSRETIPLVLEQRLYLGLNLQRLLEMGRGSQPLAQVVREDITKLAAQRTGATHPGS